MKFKILLITLMMSVFTVPLYGGNTSNSIAGQLAECVADSVKVAEDSSRPTAKDKFSLAHSLRKANKYDEAIKEAKAGQELCTDTHSKLYAQLVQIEGMCLIERKSDNKEDYATAETLLRKSYEIYKTLDVTDSWMQVACDYLCQLVSRNTLMGKSSACYEYAVQMLNHNYMPIYSLECYADALKDRFRGNESSLEEIDAAIYTEKQKMQDCGIAGITYILDYIHAHLYTWVHSGLTGYYRKDNGPELAVKYLESAISGLSLYPDKAYCLKYKYLAHRDLADYYYRIGHPSLAVENFRKCLAISRTHWKELEFYSPWNERSTESIYSSVSYDYLECLSALYKQDEVLQYCNQIIADLDKPELKELSRKYTDAIRDFVGDTIAELQDEESDDTDESDNSEDRCTDYSIQNSALIKVLQAYENGNININFDEIFNVRDQEWSFRDDACEFAQYLFDHNDYSQLIIFGERFLDWYSKSLDLSGDEFYKDDARMYEYSKEPIYQERETYHYSNGPGVLCKMYNLLALSYCNIGNYNMALKHQLHAVEIARTDSKYDPKERKTLLETISGGHFGVSVVESITWNYLDTEKTMLINLGGVYCLLSKYAEAYDVFRNVLNINSQILAASYSIGSNLYKSTIWADIKDDYSAITNILKDYVDDYLRFAELIMECDAMYDTFWQNYSYAFDEAAQNSSRESLLALNAKKSAERDLEFANYTSRIKQEDCLADIDKAEYQLNKSVDSKSVVSRSIVSVADLRKRLRNNDIAVDFQDVYFPGDTTEIYTGSYGTGKDVIHVAHIYSNPHVYANIMRSTWTLPKRVYLGDFSKDITFKNQKWVDYVYNMRDRQGASDIYKNEEFANFIWSKIIEAADIKEGENIYFVPSEIADNIAIEYLPYKGGTINSRYNISRISSLLQIGEKEHLYMATDKCVAFGGISDYGGMGSVRVNEGKNMSGDARCIVDRNYLPSLRETEALIKTIENSVPNIQPKLGYAATKQEFMKLDGNSPNILVLATHGFNFKEADLDKAQQEALFGNREEADLSSMEKGLLTSGLYLANPKGGSVLPIEGMLTARDVSMMNLNNVDVAILVGCSSAIGLNGEDGSYGLVRALKMAGVKTVIGALWDVDVDATRLLFQKFFGYYTRGLNCRDAMKKAQDDVKNTTVNDGMQRISYQNPYYWAGFVVID